MVSRFVSSIHPSAGESSLTHSSFWPGREESWWKSITEVPASVLTPVARNIANWLGEVPRRVLKNERTVPEGGWAPV